MSGRSDPDGVSVTEKQGGYSGSSAGPANDTEVHSRETPMPMEWTLTDPVAKAPAPATDVPDLRKSLRKNDDVDRDRPGRELPEWFPMAVGVIALMLVLGIGGVILVNAVQGTVAPTKPEKPAVEDLEGVPVRKGLNEGQ